MDSLVYLVTSKDGHRDDEYYAYFTQASAITKAKEEVRNILSNYERLGEELHERYYVTDECIYMANIPDIDASVEVNLVYILS